MKLSLIANRRAKILSWNSKHDDSPLIFVDSYRGGRAQSISSDRLKFNKDGSPNIRRLVLSILEMSAQYSSFNTVTSKTETTPGRNRSAFDIWRHAKTLYPDIDLFRIMETLHMLVRTRAVYGQYCHQVHRTVFYISQNRDLNLSFPCGDYRISFNTWKFLHEVQDDVST